MIDRTLTISRRGAADVTEIASADAYRETLSDVFALDLSADEVKRLALF